jgi:hypothetical protein
LKSGRILIEAVIHPHGDEVNACERLLTSQSGFLSKQEDESLSKRFRANTHWFALITTKKENN